MHNMTVNGGLGRNRSRTKLRSYLSFAWRNLWEPRKACQIIRPHTENGNHNPPSMKQDCRHYNVTFGRRSRTSALFELKFGYFVMFDARLDTR
jgi:hypothetical protein